jgi:hypothetical protein
MVSRTETGQGALTVDALAHWCRTLGLSAGQVLEDADHAAHGLAAKGVQVFYDHGGEKPQQKDSSGNATGVMIIGAAAVGALIGLILGANDKPER